MRFINRFTHKEKVKQCFVVMNIQLRIIAYCITIGVQFFKIVVYVDENISRIPFY